MVGMKKVEDFLWKAGVHPEEVNLERTTRAFLHEMESGLTGAPSSLLMIPSYIGDCFSPEPGECVAAVDAGGTNLRVSKVRFTQGVRCVVEDTRKMPMPGSRGPVEAEEFFGQLAEYLYDVLVDAARIGFCFSYPVEILPNRDGRVISLNKEVVVKGIEGMMIGEQLQKALARRGGRSFESISVLNDTAASLLGGYSTGAGDRYSSYLGFILGTGVNSCYYEENANIAKAPALSGCPGRTIVNLESGFFDQMARGGLDREFVKKTLKPEDSPMEKMTSGQYLGPLFLEYLQGAAAAGLFSNREEIRSLRELEGKDIDDFLRSPQGGNVLGDLRGLSQEDRQVIYALADAMFERAAKLVASNLSACVVKTGCGADPLRPVLITMEGSTYYKAVMMRPKVECHLQGFLPRDLGLFYQLAQVPQAVTLGAALAATCGA